MEMKKAEDMTSAKRLIAARKAAGLGQSRLAARCYYEQSTIANVEQGRARMSLSLAKAVGKALNVSVAWLLGLDAPEISYETAAAVIAAAGKDKLREVLEKMEENT